MKRLFLIVFCALFAATPVVAAAPVAKPAAKPMAKPTPNIEDRAPADRYFGRMKMSFLGINNTFTDATVQAGPSTTDSNITNKLDFASEALDDWASKFPREPELARSYFLQQRAFKKVWIKSYQDRAWTIMNAIVARYPNSFFAKQVKAGIKAGYTEHYYAAPTACIAPPLPAPTPTATPTPDVTPAGRGKRPAPSPTPIATPTPEPTPMPTATPLPGPIVTSDRKGYKVSIEPVPCEEKWTAVTLAPATATPAETPTPTAAPTPIVTAAPAKGATPAASATPLASPTPSASPTPTASPIPVTNAGDATFNESAFTLSGTRIPIVFAGMAPAGASFMPLPGGDDLKLFRILLGRDVTLAGGKKLCGAVPTYLTVRRAPATNAYDIFVTVYKGSTAPTGASTDAACTGLGYSYPAT